MSQSDTQKWIKQKLNKNVGRENLTKNKYYNKNKVLNNNHNKKYNNVHTKCT